MIIIDKERENILKMRVIWIVVLMELTNKFLMLNQN